MREVELLPYILLGASIRYLLDVQTEMPVKKPAKQNELSLIAHLSRVNSSLKSANLPVSQQAFTSSLEPLFKQLQQVPDNATLSKEFAEAIQKRAADVANVLRHEAKQLKAYSINEKRISVEKLMSSISSLFASTQSKTPISIYYKLPDIAQYDFAQAGKSIALELPTAAAFHALRGTESVLRDYYKGISSNSLSGHLLWGPMISELRKININPPAKELLDNLDNIRASFRNPTQHPEKRYDLDEAQDLFNLCVEVVNRMARDLISRNVWDDIPF